MRKVAATIAFILTVLTPSLTFALDNNGPGRGIPEKVAQRMEDRRELVASKVAALRSNMEEEKAKFASISAQRKQELKDKLKTLKDQKKAMITQRVSDNLNKVNQNRTKEMLANLDKMESLLTKVDTKAGTIKDKDMSSVTSASAEAKTKITAAREAVNAQQLKDYTVSVTTEANLKTDVKDKRDMLMSDLKEVHQQVVDARQSVSAVIKALGLVTGETK